MKNIEVFYDIKRFISANKRSPKVQHLCDKALEAHSLGLYKEAFRWYNLANELQKQEEIYDNSN